MLVVGLGSIGSRHIKVINKLLPNAEIKILRSRLPFDISLTSNEYITTLSDAIAFKPEIAIISNPSRLHISIAQNLALQGVHIMVEKPISDSLNGVVDLINTCKQKNLILAVGYNLRFLPSMEQFRMFLFQGIIGKFFSIRCEAGQYLPSWRPDIDYRQSVSAQKSLGGGVLLELSHELDYLRWIFGEVSWVRATLSKQSNLEIDVEDTAHLTLGFFSKSSKHQLVGTVNLDFIRHDHTRLCTVIGENGSLRWDGNSGVVSLLKEGSTTWEDIFSNQSSKDETYIAEWKNFLDCIKESKTPKITGEDGLRVLDIIEAARKSAITGAQVLINYTLQSSKIK